MNVYPPNAATYYVGRPRAVLLSGGFFRGAYDAIPSIAAAYGMRRLRSAYTGNLLRLRRSSDNAESDFGYLANGDLNAAEIATFLAATTGYVATWYDQSGNGNDAVQATAENQPLYVASGQNSKPVARFNGTASKLVSPAGGVTGASAHTLIVAIQPIAHDANFRGAFTLGDSLGAGANSSSTIGIVSAQWWFGGDDQVSPVAGTAATSAAILTKLASGTAVVGRHNGTQIATATQGYDIANASILFGSYQTSVGFLNTDIFEAIVSNTQLDAADYAAAEVAANAYWQVY